MLLYKSFEYFRNSFGIPLGPGALFTLSFLRACSNSFIKIFLIKDLFNWYIIELFGIGKFGVRSTVLVSDLVLEKVDLK